MGQGCTKLMKKGEDQKDLTKNEPKVYKRLRTNDTKKVKIGHFKKDENYIQMSSFPKSDQYIIQQEKAIQVYTTFMEQGQELMIKNQEDLDYFDTDDQKIIYCFYQQNQKKLKDFVQNYILNPKMRWEIWKCFIYKANFPKSIYSTLEQENLNQNLTVSISKDLSRTFPSHPYFVLPSTQSLLLSLLSCLSLHYPHIGYTQGMNFTAGFILLVSGGNVEQAFKFYVGMVDSFGIAGFYEDGFPLTYWLIYVFWRKLELVDRQLFIYMQQLQVPPESWIFQWFGTLFIYNFPQEFVVNLWDKIIALGLIYSVQIAIAIVIEFREQILQFDQIQFMQFFKEFKNIGDQNKNYQIENEQEIHDKLFSSLNQSRKYDIDTKKLQLFACDFEKIQQQNQQLTKYKIDYKYIQLYKANNQKTSFF